MNKTYLFAGASSAIAKQTALHLRSQQHRVIGLTTKSPDSVYDQCLQVADYQSSSYPSIDEPIHGLVYFPGSIKLKPFLRYSEEDFIQDYKVNCLGAVSFIQAYLPNLKQRSLASVVLMSSVAAGSGMPFHSSIAMCKSAIEGLTRALAAELAPTVRVNCVALSLTNTPLASALVNTPEKLEASVKRHPLKKIGDPMDIAYGIDYLLTDKSAWVSGQTLHIDGGMSSLRIL